MNRFLYLIRHAEASESKAHQTDLQRELTQKGKNDAKELGHFLIHQNIKFDTVICSPAIRTLTTANLLAENNIVSKPELYNANKSVIINLIQNTSNEIIHLAFVGHNPTISAFANDLCKEYIDSLSPCTLVAFQFLAPSWQDIDFGNGNLLFIKEPQIL
jgi:phosphohistidine phosphatase